MRLAALLLVLSVNAFAEDPGLMGVSRDIKCAQGTVKQIHIGAGNYDSGNGISVMLTSTGTRWWAVHGERNLNDPTGYALLNMLSLSKLTGQQVSLLDESGGGCNYFTGVVLTNMY